MFSAIRGMWREARASVLGREVDDLLSRLSAMNADMADRTIDAFAGEYIRLASRTSNFANVSIAGRKQISDTIRAQARMEFDLDVSRGIGLGLLASYLESIDLPGEEAKFIKDRLHRILSVAVQLR